MGLRKLTQWEETVAKQEQKRFWLMNIAIVCVIVMCAVLWLVQDRSALRGCGKHRNGCIHQFGNRRRPWAFDAKRSGENGMGAAIGKTEETDKGL